jgi:hypothetical protein
MTSIPINVPLASPPATTARPSSRSASSSIPSVAAWLIALGSFLSLTGLAWDIQWHSEVGPDTFFTLPHLFIYLGSTIVGLTSLVISLRVLKAARVAGEKLSLAPIPRPILIAGFGTAVFLANGAWDQWWHSVYGFDVTILSPPHIGLLTCIQAGMIGAVAAFASRSYGSGSRSAQAGARAGLTVRTAGLAFAVASSAAFLTTLQEVADVVPTGSTGVDPVQVYLVTTFVAALVIVAAVTRTVLAATLTAAFIVAFKFGLGWFALSATEWYAGSLGLFLRDEVLASGRIAGLATSLPLVVLVAGIAIDAVLLLGVRRQLPGRLMIAVMGGLSAFVLGMAYYVGTPGVDAILPSVATMLVIVPAGALTALAAWQAGNLARAVR